MRRRFAFWGSALTAGAPTGYALLGAITVVGGGSLYAFLGIGASRPTWGAIILGAFAVCVFAEGAYKTWWKSEEARREAERKAGQIGTKEGLRNFLTECLEEIRIIQREFDGLPLTNRVRMDAITESVGALGERVVRQLRLHAPEFMDYWIKNRDDYEVMTPMTEEMREAYRHNFLAWSEEQLLYILERL